jgi:hypothetical protein
VQVQAGTYPAQTVNPAGKTSPVVIRPVTGASVVIGGLDVYASHVEFQDMTTYSLYAHEGADDVTWRNMTDRGGLYIRSASNISIIGGSIGPGDNISNFITAAYQSTTPSRNILLDGVTIHDFTRSDPSAHVDCLAVDDVDGLTIRNSTFRTCEAFDIIFGEDNNSGRGARNVLIEDNRFDCCESGYYSVFFANFEGPGIFRDNSANKSITVATDGSARNLRISRNVLPYLNERLCRVPTVRFDHNTIGGGSTCGPGDRIRRGAGRRG